MPDELLLEALPPDDEARARADARPGAVCRLHARARAARAQLLRRRRGHRARASPRRPAPRLPGAALGAEWEEREEELFGPAEALHSTYRLLRDELLEGTTRAAGRLAELRLDTGLDVTHAVVRYLELLKVAALIARPEGQAVADALRDVNARILQAATAEQREVLTSSTLDDYLLDAERDARRRAQALAARDEPSLAPFLPRRGEGVMLSASDIDTYRTCPLKYKFARVFRIPQEPTIHQRFGILVHQVLERYHGGDGPGARPGDCRSCSGLLDAGWRRGGFGDSEEERQLRGKAASALTRYHERFAIRGRRADVVRAPVHVQARAAPAARPGRPGRPAAERRVRADRLQDRPPEARRAAGRGRPALAVRGRRAGVLAARRLPPGVPLPARRPEGQPAAGRRRARGVDHRGRAWRSPRASSPRGSSRRRRCAACSFCDYRLVCPAAER